MNGLKTAFDALLGGSPLRFYKNVCEDSEGLFVSAQIAFSQEPSVPINKIWKSMNTQVR